MRRVAGHVVGYVTCIGASRRRPRPVPLRLSAGIILALLICPVLYTLGLATGSARAADKALLDLYFDASASDSTQRSSTIADFVRLHAKWVRVSVSWARLEAQAGLYDQAEIARLDALIDDLGAAGIRALLNVHYLPAVG